MSAQTSFVTQARPLRAYASTADLAISPPSHREASDRARAVALPKDLRTEPKPIRFIIIALAVTFLTVFVVLPLVVVFASAFSRSEEHTSELQSRFDLVCRLLLEKK